MSRCIAAEAKPKVVCLPQLIQDRTSVQPEATAVLTRSRRLTYRELDEAANGFAGLLLEAGVWPETVVGVFMNRSPESLAALLGIWKVGAAYLALDPISPLERVAFVLQNSGASLVIAEKRLASILPAHSTQVLYADDVVSRQLPDLVYPEIAISADSLAYVLYTSGSTGKPKGVEICHGGLVNVVTAIAEELQLLPGEVLLAHSSLGFDISNLEMYMPLISGGALYIAEGGRAGDGARLIGALRESRATTMLGTSTLWRLLLDAGWEGRPDLRAISGGEVLPLELAKALCQRSAAVWNHYGPTEATICATTARIDSTTDKITIGRPISNVTVQILDSKLQPVVAGTAGELCIGGVGVARGYRNRLDLTAASFLSDPLSFEPVSSGPVSSKPGARFYKTGDLARCLPDGRLEFLGRVDNQVKIHGYRIELEEIEAHIRQFPGVSAVIVAALEQGQADRRLIAWFESKQAIPQALIREFLRKRLPPYMVPAEFRHLDAMPLNESGKVDRKSLETGILGTAAQPEAVTEPENDAESRLRSIWEDLLQTKPIMLTDSFFDLGGDSLLAALLVTQIGRRFDRKLTADALFECPTIKSLAARITLEEKSGARCALVPLRKTGSRPPLFVVPGLAGSCLLYRSLSALLGEDQPVYCVKLPSGAVSDRDEIEIKALAARCIGEIRLLFPTGPYHLGGHSLGALIAFEMAAQLAQMGEQPGLLALLDSDRNLAKPGDPARADWAAPALALRRSKAKLKSLAEKGVREVFRRRLDHIRLHKRVRLAERAVEGEFSKGNFAAEEMLVLAAYAYKPLPYRGSAVLFRAKEEVRNEADGDLGWADIVSGGLEIVDIPGGHLTAFDEPNVATLAVELKQRLSSVFSPAMTV
jgi:amino acid adenylation domain-containing protein